MIKLTIPQFHAAIKKQNADKLDIAFICPICAKVQSPRDLIRAGAGNSFEDVERFVAFSCVGRWLNAGPFKVGGDNSNGCDWTLGGLLSLHSLVVIDEDGNSHARFAVATPEQARLHAAGKL